MNAATTRLKVSLTATLNCAAEVNLNSDADTTRLKVNLTTTLNSAAEAKGHLTPINLTITLNSAATTLQLP